MAGTAIASIITQVRAQIVEPVAKFWSDDELAAIMNLGAKDLWGAILDLHQDHYFKFATAILRANATEISGVPEDCFRIQSIEPTDTSQLTGRQIRFFPRKYKHPDFVAARSQTAIDPTNGGLVIFYQIVGEGAPLGPPKILTGPKITADLSVRLQFNQTLPTLNTDSINPVPGESDNALKAWTIAFARAKETPDRLPDPGWLGVYKAEKTNITTRLTPREEQEPEVVDDLFQNE